MSQTPDKLNEELDKILTAFADGLARHSGYTKDEPRPYASAKRAITTAYVEAGYMTSEEWLKRMISELGSFKNTAGYPELIEATKRASGLLPNGKDE